MTLMYKYL